MAVYLTVIILEFVAYALSMNFKQEQQNKMFLVMSSIPIILVTALRHYTIGGNDPRVYYYHYQNSINSTLDQMMLQSRMEYGYHIFVKILSSIFENPQWLFFWTGVIFTVSVAYFIYKNSKDAFLSLLLYFTLGLFTFSLSGLRQTLAMAICLISIEMIKKRKFIPFLLIVVFAAQFHITALIFIPFYFVANIKITTLNMFIASIVIAGLVYFMDDLVSFANFSIGMDYNVAVSSGGFITVIIYLLVFALVLFQHKELLKDKTNSIMVIMAAIGLLSYVMRYFATRATERVSSYFFYAVLILLPNAVHCIKDKKERQAVYILVMILAIALFIYRTMGNTIYPYRFFWDI